jgi:hypothetical protein
MFGDVLAIFQPKEEPVAVVVEQKPMDAGRAISEIDKRAAAGTITYQVSRATERPCIGIMALLCAELVMFSFRHDEESSACLLEGRLLPCFRAQDFIGISRTFVELDGKVPGMAQLSAVEITETKRKFAKHEKVHETLPRRRLWARRSCSSFLALLL